MTYEPRDQILKTVHIGRVQFEKWRKSKPKSKPKNEKMKPWMFWTSLSGASGVSGVSGVRK